MKYYKQWTMTETLMSTVANLRKEFKEYLLRADYNQVFLWTDETEPKLLVVLNIEATSTAAQAAFDELVPMDKVQRFRVAGSFIDIGTRLRAAMRQPKAA